MQDKQLEKSIFATMSTDKKRIPETGLDPEKLLAEMESFKSGDARWKEGRTWSMVFKAGLEPILLRKLHQPLCL
jgi:hypothetical protein